MALLLKCPTPDDQLEYIGVTRTPFGVSNRNPFMVKGLIPFPPFQVKSGGHATNPGFSSTPGVLIYTGRFNQVTYDAASSTAVVGAGLVWDTVYQQLQPYNVSVLGGRVTGVSECCPTFSLLKHLALLHGRSVSAVWRVAEVGSQTFSAPLYANVTSTGYSYKTNQYGLVIDTIVGYNLVLPNGTVSYVTEATYPDLFFGLKGGFNNFVSQFSWPRRCPVPLTLFLGNHNGLQDDNVPSNCCMGMSCPCFRCS